MIASEGVENSEDQSALPSFLVYQNISFDHIEDQINQQINRVALSIVMEIDLYQVLFPSSSEVDYQGLVNVFKLKLESGVENNINEKRYYFKAYIVSPVSGDVFRFSEIRNVEQRQVVFRIRQLLHHLFYGDDDVPIDLTEAEPLSEDDFSTPRETVSEEASAVDPLRDLPEEASDDDSFSDDMDTEASSSEVQQDIDSEETEQEISNFSSPPISLERSRPEFSLSSSVESAGEIFYLAGVQIEGINSQGQFIEVENSFSRMALDIHYDYYPRGLEGNYIHFYGGAGRVVTETQYEFPVRFHLGADYRFNTIVGWVAPFVGIEYEKSSFANLATAGEGVQVWDNTVFWASAGLHFNFNRLGFNSRLTLKASNIFVGTSSYSRDGGQSNLSGIKVYFSYFQHIWNRFALYGAYQTQTIETISGLNLNNNNSQVAVSLVFN